MYRHRTAEAEERRNFDHVGIYFHILFFFNILYGRIITFVWFLKKPAFTIQ